MSITASKWPTAKVGEVCDLFSGFAWRSESFNQTGDGLPIIRIQNVATGDANDFVYWDQAYDPKFVIRSGDVLLTLSGSFRTCIWSGPDALLNQRIVKLTPHEQLDRQWFLYLLQTLLKQIEYMGRHALVNNVSIADLRQISIPLPPLSEQKRIAGILDQADGLRRKRQQALQLAEDFPSNLFYEMFGDPIHDPREWPVVCLEHICTRITDSVHAKPTYTDAGVPFISVKDITTGKLTFDDCKFIAEEDHRKYTRRCRPELMDILYTKVGATYGRPALVDTKREFSIYVSVALIKPNSKLVDPTFLHEAMASKEVKRQADRSVKGAGVPDLHLVEIRSFKLPLPPMQVQRDFVKQTEKIHGIQERMRSNLKETENLFNSLVQRAFRGDL